MSTQTTRSDRKSAQVQKNERIRKRKRFWGSVFVCLVCAAVLYLLFAFVLFKVDTIEILGVSDSNEVTDAGSSYYADEVIIQASGVKAGDSLVTLNKKELAAALQTLLPYIGNVTVKRSYPSTLTLIIEDTREMFSIESGGYILLDSNFKVLDASDTKPQNCISLAGLAVSASIPGEILEISDPSCFDRIRTILSACDSAGIEGITKIDLSNAASVKIAVNGKITVILGTTADLEAKLELAAKTMEAELAYNADARVIIDVSDPSQAYARTDYASHEEDTSEDSADGQPEKDAENGGEG